MNDFDRSRQNLLTKYKSGNVRFPGYVKVIVLGVAVFFIAEMFQKEQ